MKTLFFIACHGAPVTRTSVFLVNKSNNFLMP